MENYLPIIISGIIIFTALMWWLLAVGSVSKTGKHIDTVDTPHTASALDSSPPPAATYAPDTSVTPEKIAVAPLMPDPKPAPLTTSSQVQAPLKDAAAMPAPSAPTATPVASNVGTGDNLQMLKGLGPKVSGTLHSLGVTSFDQIASWTPDDVAAIDGKLGSFAGRIQRDNWVDQAKLLAAGDHAGFEQKYGALGGKR